MYYSKKKLLWLSWHLQVGPQQDQATGTSQRDRNFQTVLWYRKLTTQGVRPAWQRQLRQRAGTDSWSIVKICELNLNQLKHNSLTLFNISFVILVCSSRKVIRNGIQNIKYYSFRQFQFPPVSAQPAQPGTMSLSLLSLKTDSAVQGPLPGHVVLYRQRTITPDHDLGNHESVIEK